MNSVFFFFHFPAVFDGFLIFDNRQKPPEEVLFFEKSSKNAKKSFFLCEFLKTPKNLKNEFLKIV